MTTRMTDGTRAYPVFLAEGTGACKTWPFPNDFTEESRRMGGAARQDRAKAVCWTCEHRVGCLRWALDTDQEGIYGATSTADRRARVGV